MRFNVVGLKRSGQHAIIEWIANHFHGPIPFANNCVSWPPKTWKCTHVFHVLKHQVRQHREIDTPDLVRAARIVSIEDPFKKYEFDDLHIGDTCVAIIRSFWNNAASRMRMRSNHSAAWDERFSEWWLELAEAYLAKPEEWVFANYDLWAERMDRLGYRKQLADELCLPGDLAHKADEMSIDTAHKGYAGNVPSSFNKWGPRSDVNRRFDLSLKMGDPRFEKLVATKTPLMERIRELNQEIFGWTLPSSS